MLIKDKDIASPGEQALGTRIGDTVASHVFTSFSREVDANC